MVGGFNSFYYVGVIKTSSIKQICFILLFRFLHNFNRFVTYIMLIELLHPIAGFNI